VPAVRYVTIAAAFLSLLPGRPAVAAADVRSLSENCVVSDTEALAGTCLPTSDLGRVPTADHRRDGIDTEPLPCAPIPTVDDRCESWVAAQDHPGGYEGDGEEAGQAAAVSPDGSTLFVTGFSWDDEKGFDYSTVAYNAANGSRLWTARYDGPSSVDDFANDIALSPNGHRVFVTGVRDRQVDLEGRVLGDFGTIAYDAATGEEIWTSSYDGPSGRHDVAYAIAPSPDGHSVYITGPSRAPDAYESATVALRASSGEVEWSARYRGPYGEGDVPAAIEASPAGDRVFVTGITKGPGGDPENPVVGDDDWDFATVAFDAADGQQSWVARHGNPGLDYEAAEDLEVSPDGSTVFITGSDFVSGSDLEGADTVAYEAGSGSKLWAADTVWFPNALAVSPSGDRVYVGGSEYEVEALDALTGDVLWSESYRGVFTSWSLVRDLEVSPDGAHVYTTGWDTDETFRSDFATVSWNSGSGAKEWIAVFNTNLSRTLDVAVPSDLVVNPKGQVHVTGFFSYFVDQTLATDGTSNFYDIGTLTYQG
jgi:DNA-binding beta-propeller fold protein YncE